MENMCFETYFKEQRIVTFIKNSFLVGHPLLKQHSTGRGATSQMDEPEEQGQCLKSHPENSGQVGELTGHQCCTKPAALVPTQVLTQVRCLCWLRTWMQSGSALPSASPKTQSVTRAPLHNRNKAHTSSNENKIRGSFVLVFLVVLGVGF